MKHIFSTSACVCVYLLIMLINIHILLFHTNMKILFYNFPNSITRWKKFKNIDVYRFRFSCTCDLQWEDDLKNETYHSGITITFESLKLHETITQKLVYFIICKKLLFRPVKSGGLVSISIAFVGEAFIFPLFSPNYL